MELLGRVAPFRFLYIPKYQQRILCRHKKDEL
nr:MAG TPA: hypothetical protein [Bacteriophage sp.]